MKSGLRVVPPIEGVTIEKLRQIEDERGAVLHMLRRDASDFTRFGEVYFSEILPGAVKAWKQHTKQTQNVAVPVGRIRVVLFDGRVSSTSVSGVTVVELGRPDAYERIRIPPGVWYGFECLGDTPALIANCCDIPHDPKEANRCPVDDPHIPYSWSEQ